MNTSLANGLAANSTQAVMVGTQATKQAAKLAKLSATGQPSAASSLKDTSTATFQEALDTTLTAAATDSQALSLETLLKNEASTQAQSPDGSTSGLGGSIARTRKPVSTMRSSGGTVLGQTSARYQDGQSATTASGDTAKTSRTRRSTGLSTPASPQAQTSNGPVINDKKDQASALQEGTKSQETDPGLQGGQPAACPDPSFAVSTGVVTVQNSPKPVGTDQAQAKDSSTHLRLEATSQQQGVAGDPALNMTSSVSVESSEDQGQVVELKSTLQSSGGTAVSQVRVDGQGLHMDLHQQGPQVPQDTKKILSSSNTVTVERGTDSQGHMAASQETRLSGEAMNGGPVNLDGLTPASSAQSVKLSSQGVPPKDPMRVAGHNGASTVQAQIWPNAGLTVESLTDMGGPISGQIDDSAMQQLVTENRSSLHEQVVSSIRGALETQTHQLSVELNPPELGKVLIRFEQQEGSLTGLLEVDNRATADDIKQSLPQIIQNLRDSGIQVKRLDVMLNDQYQQPSRDSAFADMYQGRSGQQDQGRPWPYTDQAVYPNGSPDTAAVSPEPAQSQVSISTNGSINLLM